MSKLVSIDMGSRSINVVEGKKKGKTLIIKKAFSFYTPSNSVVDGRIEDKYSLKDSIKINFSSNKVKSKEILFSVQSNSVVMRDLTLPKAKDEQLAGAVSYEIDQYVSVDGKNNAMEFRVIDEVLEDGIWKNKVKAATMPKDMVDGYYQFVKDLRMKPGALDIHPNSISKIFANELTINGDSYLPNKSIVVVDFGYKTTMVSIISNGVLEFTRLLSYGGRDLDMVISNFYNLSPGEAETKKMEDISIERMDETQNDPDGIYALLRTSMTQLTKEIQKVLQYYSSRTSGNSIDTMFIYGGGSKLQGIDKYFGRVFNLNNVAVIETLSSPNLIIDLENFQINEYINALGAIMRL